MPKPLTDTLRDIRKGQFVERATEELAEIVKAVAETSRGGKYTITLTIKPNKGEHDQVMVEAETKMTVPKAPIGVSIFYTDLEGTLHRADPKQRQMFEDVSHTPKKVDAAQ